jgi:hypothetical protein
MDFYYFANFSPASLVAYVLALLFGVLFYLKTSEKFGKLESFKNVSTAGNSSHEVNFAKFSNAGAAGNTSQ